MTQSLDSPANETPSVIGSDVAPRNAVYRARGITKVYHMGEIDVHALRGVDLDLYEGEFVVFLGPSGSGKSTLLNILGGLDVPTEGHVSYRGRDLMKDDDALLTGYRRNHVGFVFQFYNLIPSLTARENVALVTEIARNPMNPEEALQLVNMDHRLDHFPAQLSGGEQQRVAIARAISKRPDVLLCDEPTGALDIQTGILVLEAIQRVNVELGTTTAVITHNAAIADMADRIISVADGRISNVRSNTHKLPPRAALVMQAIDRKLVRDMAHMWGQILAICAVIACGVATFVMSLSALEALRTTQANYYDQYRFADVFVGLKRAPKALEARIAEIPGVAHAETRVVRDVTLDLADLNEPAVGRLISIPENGQIELNALHLRSGRYIEPGRDDEILAAEGFVEAHNLHPGDKITAIINQRRKELRIVGTALSPEYVYTIRLGALVPDDKRFGVFWMGRQALASAFDMEGAFNDVCLDLAPGADEQEVVERLDEIVKPYGGLGSHGRRDQISNRFLSDEIKQLQRMGTIVPSIFLSVAAFLLNVVLSRIIALQRDQIAALKAFGYSNLAVGIHYLKLVLAVAIVGVVIGSGVGYWFGLNITKIYTRFYKFPMLYFTLPPKVALWALSASVVASVGGTLNVIRRAINLPPAEAMRPEPPASYRLTVLERLGLKGFFTQPSRMILRHIERRPLKAFFSSFGMALAVAILMLGRFSADSLDYLLDAQFMLVQRQDVSVGLVEPTSLSGLYEIQHLPGVVHVEPRRMVPVRVGFEHVQRRTMIQGVVDAPQLNHLVDENLQPIPLPREGIVLNSKLAQLLGVKLGDTLTIEVLEGSRPIRNVPVTGLATEFLGTFCYMNLRALNRLLGEGDSLTEVYLTADDNKIDQLYQRLEETPRVASVMIKKTSIRSFRDTVMENMLQMQFYNVIFACIIAFGVVYNTARIALSERGRELASLRVLGLTRGEISFILLGELAVLTLMALPLGIGMGWLLVKTVCTFLDTEMYRIPFVIAPATYGFSVTVVVIAAVISALVVRRRLDQLDLIAVLKTRE